MCRCAPMRVLYGLPWTFRPVDVFRFLLIRSKPKHHRSDVFNYSSHTVLCIYVLLIAKLWSYLLAYLVLTWGRNILGVKRPGANWRRGKTSISHGWYADELTAECDETAGSGRRALFEPAHHYRHRQLKSLNERRARSTDAQDDAQDHRDVNSDHRDRNSSRASHESRDSSRCSEDDNHSSVIHVVDPSRHDRCNVCRESTYDTENVILSVGRTDISHAMKLSSLWPINFQYHSQIAARSYSSVGYVKIGVDFTVAQQLKKLKVAESSILVLEFKVLGP